MGERDNLRESLRRGLLRNRQLLTQEGVVIGTIEKKGTIANWLLDYTEKTGNEPANSLDISKYITNSQNAAHLSVEDRTKVLYLLRFYEALKLNSAYAAGIIESIPFKDKNELKLLLAGNIENVDKNKELMKILNKKKNLAQKKQEKGAEKGSESRIGSEPSEPSGDPILTAYSKLPIPLAQIREKVVDLQKRVEVNPKILEQILGNSEQVRDRAYVVAALFLAAKRGDLVRRADQVTTKQFIRDILEKKLGWSAEDSAKIGIRIGNILGGEYKRWAYYDKGERRFRWA